MDDVLYKDSRVKEAGYPHDHERIEIHMQYESPRRVLESRFVPSLVFQKEKEIDVFRKNVVKNVRDVIWVDIQEACFERDNLSSNPAPLFPRTPERTSQAGP